MDTSKYTHINTAAFREACRAYKVAAVENQKTAFFLERAKEELVKLSDGRDCYFDDVFVSVIKPEPTINYKGLVAYLGVAQGLIERFMVARNPYYRVLIEKKIELYSEDN